MESNDQVYQQDKPSFKNLATLDLTKPHKFIKPLKRIMDGQDVFRFQTSRAYVDICTFIMQLNRSMCSRKIEKNNVKQIITWEIGSSAVIFSEPIKKVQSMLNSIESIIEEAPPDTGPRRFGNISFRKWHELLESRISEILNNCLSPHIREAEYSDTAAQEELSSYLLGSFGSPQRLDYGTGHELSFLAFLGCIWKLGGFHTSTEACPDGSLERSVVLGIIEPYFRLVRRLIITYTLEPAGSHGVWGLDDHTFLPYIFGSAQYCPAITENESMPVEGSLLNTPNPGDVARKNIVDRERHSNMYFAAIGFINDVKTGPFWEHSPILFDISGIRFGWAKINKGMIKMYNAEVLSKFPVVQHFRFGSLFSWDQEPFLAPPPSSVHISSQPSSRARAGNHATA